METNIARTRVKTLEESLIYIVRLLAKMDSMAGFGGVALIPDVFVWTLEQMNPSLIERLSKLDLLDTFRLRLAQYQELRVLAEPLRFENHLRAEAEMCTDLQDFGYLELGDMQYALRCGDWRPDDPLTRLCFERVLRTACAMPRMEEEESRAIGNPLPVRAASTLKGTEHLKGVTEDTSANLNAPVPEAMETALQHIRRELIANDDGREDRHWAHVYTSILGAWLHEDMPDEVTKVLAGGHAQAFFDELAQFRHQMEQAERVWNAMGKTVRALVLRADEPAASMVIAEFVRTDNTAEDEVPAWTSLLRNMVRRRGHGDSSAGRKDISNVTETHDTSAVVEAIRSDSRAKTAGYLISSADLPTSLRGSVHEQLCLAVRLPEERVHIPETLSEAPGLQCVYSQMDRLNAPYETQLSVSRAFWCKYEAMWPVLFRFRRAIPVLFVFEGRCVLVKYPFEHFSDLRGVADGRTYRWTVNVSEGPWTDWHGYRRVDTLPDGVQLKPAMLDQIVDLSETVHANPLGDAYTANHQESLPD
ncbi:hypothetical protein LJR034_005423 [Caballeronia sp. LjRoot34]|uniref:hypothetical protein n=1 Tax=Caballeronia sp. LjRoot34 TaxID=3342325 RepID=UPI003ED0D453